MLAAHNVHMSRASISGSLWSVKHFRPTSLKSFWLGRSSEDRSLPRTPSLHAKCCSLDSQPEQWCWQSRLLKRKQFHFQLRALKLSILNTFLFLCFKAGSEHCMIIKQNNFYNGKKFENGRKQCWFVKFNSRVLWFESGRSGGFESWDLAWTSQ